MILVTQVHFQYVHFQFGLCPFVISQSFASLMQAAKTTIIYVLASMTYMSKIERLISVAFRKITRNISVDRDGQIYENCDKYKHNKQYSKPGVFSNNKKFG